MKHIAMKYGQESNYMELTTEELTTLEPFLNRLGIRVRTTIYHTENGVGIHEIQAENVYKSWISHSERARADEDMTPDALSRYKM